MSVRLLRAEIDRLTAERDAALEALRVTKIQRDTYAVVVKAAIDQVESERGLEHCPEMAGGESTDEACYFCGEAWPCTTRRLRDALAPFGAHRAV